MLLAFGAVVLALSAPSVPQREQLAPAAGQLRELERSASKGGGLGAVRFSLSADARRFHYLAKAGQIDSVWQALERAGAAEVAVLYDPADARSPLGTGPALYPVFEIRVGGTLVRSHAQSAESWGADDTLGTWMGYGCVLAGAALLLTAAFARKPSHRLSP